MCPTDGRSSPPQRWCRAEAEKLAGWNLAFLPACWYGYCLAVALRNLTMTPVLLRLLVSPCRAACWLCPYNFTLSTEHKCFPTSAKMYTYPRAARRMSKQQHCDGSVQRVMKSRSMKRPPPQATHQPGSDGVEQSRV